MGYYLKRIRILQISRSIVFFLMAVELFSSVVFSGEKYCDPYLIPRQDHPYGYRIRGERCEGIYVKKVSSTALLLVSLTESFTDNAITNNDELMIKWKAPGDEKIRLRAYGIKPRLYYRMDTIRTNRSKSYLWPTNVLSALSIKKENIGLVAWTGYSIGNSRYKVYLPLQIGFLNKNSETSGYELALLPGREMTELFVSVATVDSEGNPKDFLVAERALQYGYYPPGRIVKVPIEALKNPGIYYVQIGATLSRGGATTIDFWFYHAID